MWWASRHRMLIADDRQRFNCIEIPAIEDIDQIQQAVTASVCRDDSDPIRSTRQTLDAHSIGRRSLPTLFRSNRGSKALNEGGRDEAHLRRTTDRTGQASIQA